ncbi:MAG: DUF1552 domain-containing protein, partial [Phycisphaeraceae bacterium]|nr:DUF1552 domain-containing protein [Phycisphaeraceae bacterium]
LQEQTTVRGRSTDGDAIRIVVDSLWDSAALSATQAASSRKSEPPRRFVAMSLGLGLLSDNLNPDEAGRNYKPSPYLKPLMDLKEKFTVISGTSHPGVTGGHRAEASILSANPEAGSGRGRNSISIDQYLAKFKGLETRFPSLVLGSRGANSPSYTETGSMIPAETSPSRLFSQLFVDNTPAERKRQAHRARQGRSVLDLVSRDAKRLKNELGSGDRERLDAYFGSVRELEKRLAESEAWAKRPKPMVKRKKPVDVGNPNDFIALQRLMQEMIRLALQTDSTRYICYHLGGSGGVVPLNGVNQGYHALSHHGRDKEKLEQLALVETEIVKAWGDFLRGLQEVNERGESLLDRTAVMLTSNLGNASNHRNTNMPVLVAGGGFRHGQHLAFDQKRNYPLPNFFVSLLQRHGIEEDTFATGKSTMRGLEMT